MQIVQSKDGTKISCVRDGTGPALILIGGALQTKSDRLMGAITSLLSRDFTVVSYDRRGRGESGDAGDYEIEREIEDVNAVLKDLGGTAFLFGNSSGGQLALYAAERLSGIRKVAIYEAPFIPEVTPGDSLDYLETLRRSLAAEKPGDTLKAFFKRIGVPAPRWQPCALRQCGAG